MSNKQTELPPITVRGQLFTITVDTGGVFRAFTSGIEQGCADTLAALTADLSRRTKAASVKVEVPFTVLDRSGGIRHGTAIGIHGGNGNVLARWDDRTGTEQIRGYGYDTYVMGRLSAEEAAELARLRAAYTGARGAFSDFTYTFRLDLKQAVADAIKEASGDDLT